MVSFIPAAHSFLQLLQSVNALQRCRAPVRVGILRRQSWSIAILALMLINKSALHTPGRLRQGLPSSDCSPLAPCTRHKVALRHLCQWLLEVQGVPHVRSRLRPRAGRPCVQISHLERSENVRPLSCQSSPDKSNASRTEPCQKTICQQALQLALLQHATEEG